MTTLSKTWSQENLQSMVIESGNETKASALDYINKNGFPTRRQENWKYIDLSQLLTAEFHLAQPVSTQLDIKNYALQNADVIVFVNGFYSECYSNISNRACITISPIGNESKPMKFDSNKKENNAFQALNEALFHSGICIHVSSSEGDERPLHLLHLQTSDCNQQMAHMKHQLHLADSAVQTVVESYIALKGTCEYFTNVSVQAVLNPHAHLTWYRLQQQSMAAFHFDHLAVDLLENSQVDLFQVSHGAKLGRSDLHCYFKGQKAQANIYSVMTGDSHQTLDHHTLMHHEIGETNSYQLHKSMMTDKSQGVFNGKIFVADGADKTDAQLSNPNLLLSDHAEINTKPELEIYADDVKCSHGATVGCLDEKALFYLRSRGIEASLAKRMLTDAFLDEVFDNMPDNTIRSFIKRMINHDGK